MWILIQEWLMWVHIIAAGKVVSYCLTEKRFIRHFNRLQFFR
jgi:hypothetical protein